MNHPVLGHGSVVTQSSKLANGYQCMGCNATFEARSSMVLSNAYTYLTGQPPEPSQQAYGYDLAGRNIAQTNTATAGTNTVARAYDAENHIVSQVYSGTAGGQYNCPATCPDEPTDPTISPITFMTNGTSVNYAYGPSGHVLTSSANPTAPIGGAGEIVDQLHWDGNAILLEQSTQGSYVGATALNVDDLGTGPMVYDRDMSGSIVAVHEGTDFGVWNDAPGFNVKNPKMGGSTAIGEWGANPTDPSPMSPSDVGAVFAPSREDGYTDIWGNTFQGVRVYDPVMAQWTAPDAYAGDAADPMSQKPFMWNGNNPVSYEDPSGYYTLTGGSKAERETVINDMAAAKKTAENVKSKTSPKPFTAVLQR